MPNRNNNKFNEELKKKYPIFRETNIEWEAFCIVCAKTISIKNKGKADLDQHIGTVRHKEKVDVERQPNTGKVTSCFPVEGSNEQDQASAVEATLSFHTVKHHFSFKSTDCTTKLCKNMFSDSKIAKKLYCARTKTEAIVSNILAPLSLRETFETLNSIHFIGVATDASNHKAQKIFPILIQFFDSSADGITTKLLEIKSLPNEKAFSISDMITTTLRERNLLQKCVSFTGDNCNTNFGGIARAGEKNVFYNLKRDVNKNLIGVGCPAHIIHKSIQHATDLLPIDIESIILKIYNYFSIYTIRTEKLKDFCDICSMEYRNLLYHSKTRWLSLFPAIERVLQMYSALSAYFLSESDAPAILVRFFENEFSEGYLWFVHSLAFVFQSKTAEIEREDNSVLEICKILTETKETLEGRLKEEFLSLKVREVCNKSDDDAGVLIFKKNFSVYERSLIYLNKWTQSLEEFTIFNWMNLQEMPSWNDVQDTIRYMKEKNIDIVEEKCFQEYGLLKKYLETCITDPTFTNMLCHQKWAAFFKAKELNSKNMSELPKMCQFIFSIISQCVC